MSGTNFRTRVRIHHGRTVKDGWHHETSVELEWDGAVSDEVAQLKLQDLTATADHIARAETERRRRLDAEGQAA